MRKQLFILAFILICGQSIYTQKPVGAVRSKGNASAEAHIKKQLVGTWSLVLVDNIDPSGKRTQPYGENPHGLLIFDTDGGYAIQILRADRPNFASGDKTKGTADENKALVLGNNSHFGRYAIDAAEKTITFKIDHAFFPNWQGTEQNRPFTLTNDEFRYSVPTTTNGTGVSGEVVWKRNK